MWSTPIDSFDQYSRDGEMLGLCTSITSSYLICLCKVDLFAWSLGPLFPQFHRSRLFSYYEKWERKTKNSTVPVVIPSCWCLCSTIIPLFPSFTVTETWNVRYRVYWKWFAKGWRKRTRRRIGDYLITIDLERSDDVPNDLEMSENSNDVDSYLEKVRLAVSCRYGLISSFACPASLLPHLSDTFW